MLISPLIILLGTCFVWWAATGVILVAVKTADRRGGKNAHLALVLWALPVLALGFWGLFNSAQTLTLVSVTVAFLSALAVWGWVELAFLCGIITGPNSKTCPENTTGLPRLAGAIGTILYSEIVLVAVGIWAVFALAGAANPFGLWTYLVLFFARVSAKINVFMGVPNINTEFLPKPVSHLASHFRIAPMNAFFAWSVTILSFAVACWMERLIAFAPASPERIGFMLLATLTALALLEHWMMVLPLGDAKLWRWMLPRSPHKSTIINGSLPQGEKQ